MRWAFEIKGLCLQFTILGYNKGMLKRALDIILALLMLVIALPLFFIIGITILLNMGRPIFFVQPRPGYKGKIFSIYKFRTMRGLQQREDPLLSDANRITPFGRVLRRLSIDELPELFNVFRGDMSIVGPRPLLVQYLSRYTPEQMKRHDVRPGITGLAQVRGRNVVEWARRLDLDIWYVNNRNIWLDIKIFCLTFYKIIKREGISQPGHATCEEFIGKDEK